MWFVLFTILVVFLDQVLLGQHIRFHLYGLTNVLQQLLFARKFLHVCVISSAFVQTSSDSSSFSGKSLQKAGHAEGRVAVDIASAFQTPVGVGSTAIRVAGRRNILIASHNAASRGRRTILIGERH